ncbi:hypothetical protein BJX99DRAFT_262049 [Aspergillus californicus]
MTNSYAPHPASPSAETAPASQTKKPAITPRTTGTTAVRKAHTAPRTTPAAQRQPAATTTSRKTRTAQITEPGTCTTDGDYFCCLNTSRAFVAKGLTYNS